MDYRYLGAQVRKRRLELGYTQAQVAEAIDVSTSFVGHIERGTRKPSLETMAQLAIYMRCQLDLLVLPPRPDVELPNYTPQQVESARRLLEAAANMCR